jgi:hypothetical protein
MLRPMIRNNYDDGSPYGRKAKDLTNYDDEETKEK